MPPMFTPEQDRLIVEMYQQGMSLRTIAKIFGSSDHPILKALKRQGIKSRPNNIREWHATPGNHEEVIRLWGEGLSITDISLKLEGPKSGIAQILRDAGIRTHGGRGRWRTKSDKEEIAREYADGASLREIARRRGCDSNAIRIVLRNMDIPIRDPLNMWPAERITWLREQRMAGRTIADIAAELNLSQGHLCNKLREFGIKERTRPKGHQEGVANPQWKGGRSLSTSGYVLVRPSDKDLHLVKPHASGHVFEHRLIMARLLGRPLTRYETVHHINGDRTDNRPENLQLRQGAHGAGVASRCLDCGSINIETISLAESLNLTIIPSVH